MTRITKEQVLAQLERVCKQADEALAKRDMHRYEALSIVRGGLRIAVGHVNQNRDPGNIHIDEDILNPKTIEDDNDEDANDVGQD